MPNTPLILPAPAKINLFLHICGKRSDGYHNLQTVFQFLNIADELTFLPTHDGKIILTTPLAGITQEDNLIFKAANALQKETRTTLGVQISINKNLPMGGGIGGGSSNAATTLIALNIIWNLGLTVTELKNIGVRLGADVPIFIHGHSAWAEGIGEQLTNIDLPEIWYLLIIPKCHVSTASIFSHSDLTRDTKMMKMSAFLDQGNSSLFHNDCEDLVKKLYSEVDQAFNALSNFSKARMTGTGACIFATFNTEIEAQNVCEKLPKHLKALVTKGSNQSPLHKALEKNCRFY